MKTFWVHVFYRGGQHQHVFDVQEVAINQNPHTSLLVTVTASNALDAICHALLGEYDQVIVE